MLMTGVVKKPTNSSAGSPPAKDPLHLLCSLPECSKKLGWLGSLAKACQAAGMASLPLPKSIKLHNDQAQEQAKLPSHPFEILTTNLEFNDESLDCSFTTSWSLPPAPTNGDPGSTYICTCTTTANKQAYGNNNNNKAGSVPRGPVKPVCHCGAAIYDGATFAASTTATCHHV